MNRLLLHALGRAPPLRRVAMMLPHNGATCSVGLPLPGISACTRVFDALSGEGWGEGVTADREPGHDAWQLQKVNTRRPE
jgi:hypothetical protein